MKRIICLLLVFSTIMLYGCCKDTEKEDNNAWEPDIASEDVKPYAEQAIDILDQYFYGILDIDEAAKELSSLCYKLSKLNIEEKTMKYNQADVVIWNTLNWLKDIDSGHISNIELQQKQDILRTQIGKECKNGTYNYEDFLYNIDDTGLCDCINFEAIPASIMIWEADDGVLEVILDFDYMYGVSGSDVLSYTEDVLWEITDNSIDCNISVFYRYYEQSVFYLLAQQKDNSFTGRFYAVKSRYYSQTEDFNSIEELMEAHGNLVLE